MIEIKLGAHVRCKITKAEGTVTGLHQWINSHSTLTIQPSILKDGRPVETFTLDIDRAEIISSTPVIGFEMP